MFMVVEMVMVMDEVVEVVYFLVEGIEVLIEGMMLVMELVIEVVLVVIEKMEVIRLLGIVEVMFVVCMSEINNCRNRVRRIEFMF